MKWKELPLWLRCGILFGILGTAIILCDRIYVISNAHCYADELKAGSCHEGVGALIDNLGLVTK